MSSHLTSRLGRGIDGTIDLSKRVLQKQEFGNRLYSVMLERNMSQSDLARSAGLGRDSISTYVRGRSVPTPSSLEKLAKALNVDAEELYPNYSANAAAIDEPILQFKQVNDGSGMMWLTVNMKIEMDKAVQIMKILKQKD